MMTIIEQFIIIVLLATIMGQQCRPNKYINDFYSDSATFSIPTIQNNTLSFSYKTYNISLSKQYNQHSNIQYAFAIKDIAVKTSTLYYFDLLVLKTYQSHLILNFIYEPNKWTVITYNYWISYREDLLMGIQTYSINYIKKNDEEYSINHIIKKKLTEHYNQHKLVTLIYLNGMRSDFSSNSSTNQGIHYLYFSIKSQKIINSSLNIVFQCSKTSPVKSISFSYLVYMPQSIDLVSYGGTITYHDFKGRSTSNLKYILPDQQFYSLYGISTLILSKQVKYSEFNLQSQMNRTYSFNMAVKQWQLLPFAQITYVIIGKMPAALCRDNLQCKLEERIYIYDDLCVDQCPSNANIIKYIDGSIQCPKCPSNTNYNSSTNKCVCNEGFTLSSDNSTCVKIQSPTQPIAVIAGVTNSISRSQTNENLGQTNQQIKDCFNLLKMQSNQKSIFITLQAKISLKDNLTNLKNNQFKLSFLKQNTKPYNYYCIIDTNSNYKYNCLLLYNTAVPSSTFNILIQITSNKNKGINICQSTFEYPNNK